MGVGLEEYLSYQELLTAFPGGGRVFLLLGNGFSIACDPVFRYASLYDQAVEAGLSVRAQAVFERLGTNNFEGVLRLLEDAEWIAGKYEVRPKNLVGLQEDATIVRRTLIEAVARAHLNHPGEIAEEKKVAARQFVSRYHHVFTTNYALLLYWVVLHGDRPSHQDGFRPDPDDPEAQYLVFSERLGEREAIFFLHGAIHLYLERGELRKHSWVRTDTRLTELIRDGLQKHRYPLFVAEGTPEKKLDQIQRVGYLWYALEKFSRIEKPLVIFGHSLGDADRHISTAIARNTRLTEVFVGLHGDPQTPPNQLIRARAHALVEERRQLAGGRGKQLAVRFYDSASAAPWG